MPSKKKQSDETQGAPLWVVTYGDMMSLLLCFFVLLLSFSTISEDAFNQALMSLQGAFGVFERYDGVLSTIPRQPRETVASLERMARELQRQMQVLAKETDVKIEFDEEAGLKISLPNAILFGSGSAELRPEAYPVLDELADVLKDLPDAFIEVRGHTDGRPLARQDRLHDNHDLSYRRADAVTRRLNEFGGIPINQFEIVACGPSQPIATNDTLEGREANRRVEIQVRGAFNRAKVEALRKEAQTLMRATDRPGEEESP